MPKKEIQTETKMGDDAREGSNTPQSHTCIESFQDNARFVLRDLQGTAKN
jgi:hypothetical protein